MKHAFTFIILFIFSNLLYPQVQYDVLEKAFRSENSFIAGFEFFQRWQKEYRPITDEELDRLPDAEKEVHKIFTLLFQPFKPYNIIDNYISDLKYGTKDSVQFDRALNNFLENKDIMYNIALGIPYNVRFIVVQDEIRYSYLDSLDFESIANDYISKYLYPGNENTAKITAAIKDTLTKLSYDEKLLLIHKGGLIYNPPPKSWINILQNFRPRVDFHYLGSYNKYAKVLYQSAFYDSLLNKFLYNGKEEIYRDRIEYIENFTPIITPFGMRYQFLSFPNISEITFLNSLNKALVSIYFTTFNTFDVIHFILEKVNGEWIIKYQR
jgi:hypothetical protein